MCIKAIYVHDTNVNGKYIVDNVLMMLFLINFIRWPPKGRTEFQVYFKVYEKLLVNGHNFNRQILC